MLLVPLISIIVGLALVYARDVPKRSRAEAEAQRMARSLANAVRLTNADDTCAALSGEAAPEPIEDGRAKEADLTRRAGELRSRARTGRGVPTFDGPCQRAA